MPAANTVSANPKYKWNEGWLLYLGGADCEEVAHAIQAPLSRVYEYCRDHRWVQLRQETRKLASQTIRADLERRIEAHRAKHLNFVMDTLEETQKKIQDADIVLKAKKDQELGENEITVSTALSLTRSHDELARKTLGLDNEENNNLVEKGFAMLLAMRSSENTPAIPPYQNDSRGALAGILSPFNGHSNGLVTHQIEAHVEPITAEPGQTSQIEETTESRAIKPLPATMQFKTPANNQSLVNETNEDQGTSTSTES